MAHVAGKGEYSANALQNRTTTKDVSEIGSRKL